MTRIQCDQCVEEATYDCQEHEVYLCAQHGADHCAAAHGVEIEPTTVVAEIEVVTDNVDEGCDVCGAAVANGCLDHSIYLCDRHWTEHTSARHVDAPPVRAKRRRRAAADALEAAAESGVIAKEPESESPDVEGRFRRPERVTVGAGGSRRAVKSGKGSPAVAHPKDLKRTRKEPPSDQVTSSPREESLDSHESGRASGPRHSIGAGEQIRCCVCFRLHEGPQRLCDRCKGALKR